jgi:hypothetical protein
MEEKDPLTESVIGAAIEVTESWVRDYSSLFTKSAWKPN